MSFIPFMSFMCAFGKQAPQFCAGALQVKFRASSVLPVPRYLATSGYWQSGRERVIAPV